MRPLQFSLLSSQGLLVRGPRPDWLLVPMDYSRAIAGDTAFVNPLANYLQLKPTQAPAVAAAHAETCKVWRYAAAYAERLVSTSHCL